MSDFRALPHIPEGVEPGFAHVTPSSDAELVRVFNAEWSHRVSPCWRPAHEGQEL